MVADPYVFDGIVYDVGTNGTAGAALSGATVWAFNVSTGEWLYTTTGTDGAYLLDIANLTSQYVDGDKIILTAYKKGRSVNYIATVSVASGGETKDLKTMIGDKIMSFYTPQTRMTTPVNLYAYSIANTSGSAARLDFYEAFTANKLMSVNVPANNTISTHFPYPIAFAGGIAIVPQTDSVLDPTIVVN